MDLQEIIVAAGYAGLGAIIFSESGLLFGVFFPGDSLLFTAGFLASQGIFHIVPLVTVCFVAAVLGDSAGYAFGRRVGKRFFTRDDSVFFNRENVERARAFYDEHGGKTIVLARFIPGIRTLAPIIAGVGDMQYRAFLAYNVVGGFAWAVGITLLGYFLGASIPGIDRYLVPIIGVIIVASLIPAAWQIMRSRERRRKFTSQLTRTLRRLWHRP